MGLNDSICNIDGMELKKIVSIIKKVKWVITMIVEVDACSSKKCGEYLCHLGVN